jgi:hypothetical protein
MCLYVIVLLCIYTVIYSVRTSHSSYRRTSAGKGKQADRERREHQSRGGKERLCFLGFVCKRHIRLHALVEDGWMDGWSFDIYRWSTRKQALRHSSRSKDRKKRLAPIGAKQQLLLTTTQSSGRRTRRHKDIERRRRRRKNNKKNKINAKDAWRSRRDWRVRRRKKKWDWDSVWSAAKICICILCNPSTTSRMTLVWRC